MGRKRLDTPAKKESGNKPKNLGGRPPKYILPRCTRCGKEHASFAQNFVRSQSPLYVENDRYLPVCKSCINEMYLNYKDAFDGDDKAAIRRICMKFDIYWSDKIYASLKKTTTTASNVMIYIRTAGLQQYKDKTFDDTLTEEAERGSVISISDATQDSVNSIEVSPDIVDFWGGGLTPSFYFELEHRLKKWLDGRDIKEIDIGEITVIKQICLLEVMINHDIATGNTKSVEKNVRALDALLGSANLKPVQKKIETPEEKDTTTPFGVWIKKIEEEEPIPEPEDRFKDVDNIAKYISVWFLGHLSKVLNVKNRYSDLYEEEIAKYTVERPEYEGYDDEEVLEDIFDKARKEAEVEAKRAEKLGGTNEDE